MQNLKKKKKKEKNPFYNDQVNVMKINNINIIIHKK